MTDDRMTDEETSRSYVKLDDAYDNTVVHSA
jgi:hypothetical protein